MAELLKPRPNQEAETIYATSETRQPHAQKFPQPCWKTRLSGRADFQIHKPVGDIFLFNWNRDGTVLEHLESESVVCVGVGWVRAEGRVAVAPGLQDFHQTVR